MKDETYLRLPLRPASGGEGRAFARRSATVAFLPRVGFGVQAGVRWVCPALGTFTTIEMEFRSIKFNSGLDRSHRGWSIVAILVGNFVHLSPSIFHQP